MLNRRTILKSGVCAIAVLAAGRMLGNGAALAAGADHLKLSDAEWHQRLTDDQYAVLRQEATERPFTSPLLHEERTGVFTCAGCDLALFSSKTKFDSGTGWPSFWAPLDNAVLTKDDNSFGMTRTAVACRRCEGHLGHVFDDGPKPTGLRYCMNGVALKFVAAAA
ncbi:putative methionine sulfoxide reductase [Labrys miyagiensis]|uniref:peptide-methionine (R)-S-oxide reductase n=1 Tax=Labrys miyagiensis TaxID=346912 RepID=A0ABQ6CIE2_9HYPH|nr:peptide-methionine (R)-S-oxide reductase MsrB [Labrys miyagiensis]GLS19695.1 putative methionine sulfoxide reductase [Labrys miyagiensis]